MKESLEKGNSFPRARAEAVRRAAGEDIAEILEQPNNILAVEYIRELMLTKSNIVPVTIRRKGQGYHSTALAGDFASASGIRKSLQESSDINHIREYVPEACFLNIKKLNMDINEKFNKLFMLLCAKILSESEENLEEIFSAGEGLGHKMKKVIRGAQNLEDLISGIKSKRYTRTRIQRLLTHTLTGFRGADFKSILDHELNYARALAFNNKGAALLKKIKESHPQIPVITNINKQVSDGDEIAKLLRYDILASDIYNLISGRDIYENSDFVIAPYYKVE